MFKYDKEVQTITDILVEAIKQSLYDIEISLEDILQILKEGE